VELSFARGDMDSADMARRGGGNRGGTSGFASDITWWQYLFTQSEGIVRYLKLSFWPIRSWWIMAFMSHAIRR